MLLLGAIAAPPAADAAGPAPFTVPAESTIPSGPDGEAIKLGRTLINDTRRQLPANVGNGLNCASCHLGAGTTPLAGPFVGLWGVFPEYFARSGGIDSLQQRIEDCFLRSMNGRPLAWNSKEMNAILMYVNWLSTGVPVGAGRRTRHGRSRHRAQARPAAWQGGLRRQMRELPRRRR